MKPYQCHSFLFLMLFFLLGTSTIAQEQPQEFALPVARLGEDYRVEIESVLRDKYQLRLESGNANAVILWTTTSGEVPAGLSVRTDGTIIGNTKGAHSGLYQFSLKAVDMAVRNEPLELRFSLEVRAGRLRLTRLEGPRLVPVSTTAPITTEATSSLNHASRTTAFAVEEAAPPVKKEETPEPDVRKIGDAVGADFANPFSSMNKRFIVGVEQSGAASAKSEGKPFMDLFINTPLWREGEDATKPPRFSLWGDVRLTSTPEQISAFSNISANAIDAITGEANELIMGFDFVVGPELRIGRFKNVDMGVIAAFGAISPLSPEQSAQIFEVPAENSSQAEAFFEEFPGAKGKEHIAFITPDRDRFLRQYFGGLRFKTYTRDSNGDIQNVFPSMLDLTFGQSEAVTGGRLHKFVFGIDGFYVLPFPDQYRFLYLFGTAKFKVGGPKLSGTSFILATPSSSVNVTDPTVFIADPRSSNRDVYRIGFGVDLFELFRKQ